MKKLTTEIDFTTLLPKVYLEEASKENTKAIQLAFKMCSESIEISGVFVPSGVYLVEPIKLLKVLKTNSKHAILRGEGKRNSILKLANNSNEPLFETDLYFNVSFSNIGFDGNKANNDVENLLVFNSAHVYDVVLDNIYIKDAPQIGILADNVTHLTINNPTIIRSGEGGIKIKNALSISINSPDIEQSGKYAILLESDKTQNERYFSPLINIRNPYVEQNPIGIWLKGICRVNIEGGFNRLNTFVKISASDDGESFSHYNNIKSSSIGKIVIDKGNYGNFVPVDFTAIEDSDGRTNDYLSSEDVGYIKASDLKLSNVKNHILSYTDDKVKINSSSDVTASTVFVYPITNDKYLYLKVKGSLNSRVSLRIYDLELQKYYNFCTKNLQDNHRDTNVDFIVYTNGNIQYLKIPLELTETLKPRLQVNFSSKNDFEAVTEFYGYKLL